MTRRNPHGSRQDRLPVLLRRGSRTGWYLFSHARMRGGRLDTGQSAAGGHLAQIGRNGWRKDSCSCLSPSRGCKAQWSRSLRDHGMRTTGRRAVDRLARLVDLWAVSRRSRCSRVLVRVACPAARWVDRQVLPGGAMLKVRRVRQCARLLRMMVVGARIVEPDSRSDRPDALLVRLASRAPSPQQILQMLDSMSLSAGTVEGLARDSWIEVDEPAQGRPQASPSPARTPPPRAPALAIRQLVRMHQIRHSSHSLSASPCPSPPYAAHTFPPL